MIKTAQSCPQCMGPIPDPDMFCPHCGAELDRSNDQNVGQVINGAYAIRELIGGGSMGRVYLAEQLSLKKTVAIKLLRKAYAQDERAKRRFEREAMASSRLEHPNSITVIDFGVSEQGHLFLVTEHIAGTSLGDIVEHEGALPPLRVADILIQICSALVEAHEQGVIHRDLKLDNVMIRRQRDGRDLVKVLDFGIAHIQSVAPSAPRLTRAGLVCGTPEYMSPEQARGDELDARSDIYAMGVMMYELLTGELPFDAPSATDIVTMHMTQQPDPPSQRRPDLLLPGVLESICLKALAKQREDRFSSALELQLALEEARKALPPEAASVIKTEPIAPSADGTGLGNLGSRQMVTFDRGRHAQEDELELDHQRSGTPELGRLNGARPIPGVAAPPSGTSSARITPPSNELGPLVYLIVAGLLGVAAYLVYLAFAPSDMDQIMDMVHDKDAIERSEGK